ncbi:MAG: hypothetical protein II953_04355, partial [Clostridia bacterium]|nr:hypothetical protein [Clostridia bacterium]
VQLKHAQDKSCGLRQRFRRALGTERADGMLKLFLCLRARFEIQTDVQTEPRERKPSGRNMEFWRQMFHVKQFLIHHSEF